jgi:hypothetical protein
MARAKKEAERGRAVAGGGGRDRQADPRDVVDTGTEEEAIASADSSADEEESLAIREEPAARVKSADEDVGDFEDEDLDDAEDLEGDVDDDDLETDARAQVESGIDMLDDDEDDPEPPGRRASGLEGIDREIRRP